MRADLFQIGVIILAFSWQNVLLKVVSNTELERAKEEWTACCEQNICIQNSCYFVEWLGSGWSTVRQRCQARYPDWPFAVDIFRIQDEEDIETISQLFQNSPEVSPPSPRSLWMSGTRCPKAGDTETIQVTGWTSTKYVFPAWLESKLNETYDSLAAEEDNGCKFLVMFLSSNGSAVKFDFQDQRAQHPAVCEFFFPGSAEISTQTTMSEYVTTTDTNQFELTNSTSTFEITLNDLESTSIKSASFSPAGIWYSSTWSETPEPVRTTTATTSMDKFTSKPTTKLSSETPDAEAHELLTTKAGQFCKSITIAGITWPDAEPGVTVNKSCPDGMTGFAQWTCSEVTLEYTPENPNVHDCKHIWITDLEEDVNTGGNAIVISDKMAEQTEKQNMSHGDITALVDLSTKVLRLFAEQNDVQNLELLQEEEDKVSSFNFTGSMVTSMSNILRYEIKTAWEVLPKIHQTRAASKILEIVTNVGSRLSCMQRSENKLQYTIAAENIGLQTFLLNRSEYLDEEEVIVFPQEAPGVVPDSSLTLPSNLKLESWYSPCKSYKTAVGVIYNYLGDFLKDESIHSASASIVSKVLSFSLSNNTKSIKLPAGQEIIVALQHLTVENIRLGLLKNPRCVFWNFSKEVYGQWDSSGCRPIGSNMTHTICTCDHLTNFAILMDINDNSSDDELQTMLTYICCGISSLTLAATLLCLLTIRSLHGRRSIITGNLCLSLLITNLLIIFGLDQIHNKVACAIIAGFLQFWILSAFFWMLVEGYQLYTMVIIVFQRGANFRVISYYAFAYGGPLVIVGISAAVRTDGYGGEKYCWLSNNNGLMWSFVGPACAVILVNIVIFILTLRSASSVRIKKDQTTLKRIKSWARGSLSVMCLLGLTWCLGFFYINKKLHVFSYIFTLLNGLQGVFIFIFHILLNDKMKTVCYTKWKGRNPKRWKNHASANTSSNRLQSKTSTQTSIHSNGYANASISAPRTITSEIPPTYSTTYQNDIRSNSINVSVKNLNTRHSKINYRKPKATHTKSENGFQRYRQPEPYKVRSQSFPDDHVSQKNSSNLHSENSIRKDHEYNSNVKNEM